jgi:hypothetical protein
MTKMGRKYEITHTQTFSRKFDTRCNGQLACVLLFTFHSESSKQWFVDNNTLAYSCGTAQEFQLDYDLKYKFVIPKSLDSLLMLF